LIRVTYIFFIALSFLLLGKCNYVHASAINNVICNLPSQDIKETQKVKITSLNQNAVVTNISLTEDDNYLIDDEDEDENVAFNSKYVLIAKFFIILSYTFIFSYLYSRFKTGLPVCKHLSYIGSYKYLIQRALKI
jgi:hypothetical protein